MDSHASGKGPVMDFCEYCNGLSVSIKAGIFDPLSNYKFFKKRRKRKP
jgi:hypothetical protein